MARAMPMSTHFFAAKLDSSSHSKIRGDKNGEEATWLSTKGTYKPRALFSRKVCSRA
ncbi:hypothetical protein VS_0200 [Vibrio atlanticus]|uniref:Uncharacterized protein n=1 Tax=Vibrio atlanticus (strain LGP32) TaxID=575788 RepID=B7VHM0_VIBA3|nr:hypothetical protein VS_0200 [Vibrio atlanticus]